MRERRIGVDALRQLQATLELEPGRTCARDVEVVRLRRRVLVVDQIAEGVGEVRRPDDGDGADVLLDAGVDAERVLGIERAIADDVAAPFGLEKGRLAEGSANAGANARARHHAHASRRTIGPEVAELLVVLKATTER